MRRGDAPGLMFWLIAGVIGVVVALILVARFNGGIGNSMSFIWGIRG